MASSTPTQGSAVARRWRYLDVIVAVLAVAGLIVDAVVDNGWHNLPPAAWPLALVTGAPLVARRRAPLLVLAAVVPLLLVCLGVFHPSRAAVGIVMLLVFTVGMEGHRSRSLTVGALMAPVVTAGILVTSPSEGAAFKWVTYLALVLAALAAGEALRARREVSEVRHAEAEREREAQIQHRFDEQRLRLANELHDIVGHALVAINVRAAAAAHLARKEDGDVPAPVLDEIATASAEALGEVRSALKSLRRPGPSSDAPLRPPADLGDLPGLVSGVERSGLSVDLRVDELPTVVPHAVGHAGYRIIQEGLTNVLRHSTATRAAVRVGAADGSLVVEVIDHGRERSGSAGDGNGLQGMRERASALGGGCEAGRLPGGGWRIRCWLPTGTGA
ncbi:MAG TPA: histidine kinase [Candidatus Dormibacteraeota bacterium]|nr:histidine kinase [Candidatus Dormibacteraeota bacterium]